MESSRELLDKDIVQLHAPKWQSMREVCHIHFSPGGGGFNVLFNLFVIKFEKYI